MKKYKVKVNGKLFEVELEAVEETKGTIETPKAQTVVDVPVPQGTNKILAPIGGKVLDVLVKVGDTVRKGDNVCIIEAMKLENEVKSGFDGKVVDVKVSKGQTVANKDVVVILG